MVSDNRAIILIAEDDDDDRFMIRVAFRKSKLLGDLRFVRDGEELMDYLRRRGEHKDALRPSLVVLDLNMPRMNGREALAEIRADEELADLPIMVLTTSDVQEDKDYCAKLGVVDYIIKPSHLEGLLRIIDIIEEHCRRSRLLSAG